MVTLLDPTEPEVREIAESTRGILVRLEATPFAARLDTAMSRGPGARVHSDTRPEATAELTAAPAS